MSIESVSKMLGHNNIKTTQIYAQVIESKISSDIEKIYFIETTSDGCLGDTVWLQIVVESYSSVTHTQIDDLNIYPNPSRDVFNIEFSSLVSQDLKIRIINSVGDVVFIEDLQNYNGEYKKQISLEEYSKAIYFLEIQTDKGIVNKKLILQ